MASALVIVLLAHRLTRQRLLGGNDVCNLGLAVQVNPDKH